MNNGQLTILLTLDKQHNIKNQSVVFIYRPTYILTLVYIW